MLEQAVRALTGCAPRPCYHIPRVNSRFVGREKTLGALRDVLFGQGGRKAALVGLGGVGKTQVALTLAYWTKENMPDRSVFWVPALSHATFEQAYADMARKLPIQKSREDDDDEKELVRRYLSSDWAGSWLLIVDNAADREQHDTGLEKDDVQYSPTMALRKKYCSK